MAVATSRERSRPEQKKGAFEAAHGEISENCAASVQFEGKVQRIALVHHCGLRDRVSRAGRRCGM